MPPPLLLLRHHARLRWALSLLFMLLGAVWITVLFPQVCVTTGEMKPRGTYFSENALMGDSLSPRQVEPADWAAPWPPLQELGLMRLAPSVHLLFPATPGDKRDAIAIVVTPNSPPSLAVAAARLCARVRWLSKNIVFFTPRTAIELRDALSSYADEAGPIRQALVLNATSSSTTTGGVPLSKLLVLSHGLNGQLPNLDLVNLAVKASEMSLLEPVVTGDFGKIQLPSQFSLGLPPRYGRLFNFASQVAFGPSGWHAVFLANGIDALTLAGPLPEKLVTTLEMLLRSLSGLDEKLHHSYFFYLLMDTDRFVSVEEYLWPVLLFCAPMASTVFYTAAFFNHEAQGLSRVAAAWAAYALLTFFGTICFMAASDKPRFSWFLSAVISSGFARSGLHLELPSSPLRWDYVLAVASLILFLVHTALGMLDFPLAVFSASIVVPPMLLACPPPASLAESRNRPFRTASWLLAMCWLLATLPQFVFSAIHKRVALNPDFYQGETGFAQLSYAAHHFGSLHLGLWCLVLYPAQLALWATCTGVFGTQTAELWTPPVDTSVEKQPTQEQMQVGGSHENVSFSAGCVGKSETDADQFDTEVGFYHLVHTEHDSLASVVPRLIQVKKDVKPRVMLLEDLTKLVSKNPQAMPVSVMDVKMGLRSFRQDAPNKAKSEYFVKYKDFTSKMTADAIEAAWASVASVWWTPAIAVDSAATPLSANVAKILESPSDAADMAALSRLPSLLGLDENEAAALLPITSPAPRLPPSLSVELLGKRDYLLFRDATTTSAAHGFRLTACSNGAYKVSQSQARLLSTYAEFVDVMTHFTSGGNRAIVEAFLRDLDLISKAIELSLVFGEYDFVGTSLLFLYCASNNKAAVRWIDFANVTQPVSDDYNGIQKGVEELKQVLRGLLK